MVYISYGHLLAEGSITEIIAKANLVTWAVLGDDLMVLEKKLRGLPGVEQVIFFGNKLHVSGTNPHLFNQSIAPFKNSNWQQIPSSLEDAFINFVAKADHQQV